MTDKPNLAQSVPDVVGHPWIVKLVATATTATGASTVLGVFQVGIGIVASTLGAMLTYAIWRKVREERKINEATAELNRKESETRMREAELRIEEAEIRLAALKKDADS